MSNYCDDPAEHGCGRTKAPRFFDHTIVIAPDHRTAESVAKFYAYKEHEPILDLNAGPFDPHHRADLSRFTVTAYGASPLRALEGRRNTRVIIVDYLKWRGQPPGYLADLWREIWVRRDFHGGSVIWQ